jgi:hypothetical protein
LTSRNFDQPFKIITAAFTALMILAGASSPSQAASGRVRLHIVKAGFIIGVGGGNGWLYFQGRTYRLNLGGIGVGTLGIAAVDLVGTASNLNSPYDIAGTYSVAGAGAAVVAGAAAATLQNERGVLLQVHGVQAGLQVSLGLGGMTISLQ